MTIYEQIAIRIIKEQELLMGPLAWSEAGKVANLKVIDVNIGSINIEGSDKNIVINDLIGRFVNLFGRAGLEVCKEAVSSLVADMQPSQIPSSLR